VIICMCVCVSEVPVTLIIFNGLLQAINVFRGVMVPGFLLKNCVEYCITELWEGITREIKN
jgi:hypothetical protein